MKSFQEGMAPIHSLLSTPGSATECVYVSELLSFIFKLKTAFQSKCYTYTKNRKYVSHLHSTLKRKVFNKNMNGSSLSQVNDFHKEKRQWSERFSTENISIFHEKRSDHLYHLKKILLFQKCLPTEKFFSVFELFPLFPEYMAYIIHRVYMPGSKYFRWHYTILYTFKIVAVCLQMWKGDVKRIYISTTQIIWTHFLFSFLFSIYGSVVIPLLRISGRIHYPENVLNCIRQFDWFFTNFDSDYFYSAVLLLMGGFYSLENVFCKSLQWQSL